jgi:hypothetical protein
VAFPEIDNPDLVKYSDLVREKYLHINGCIAGADEQKLHHISSANFMPRRHEITYNPHIQLNRTRNSRRSDLPRDIVCARKL